MMSRRIIALGDMEQPADSVVPKTVDDDTGRVGDVDVLAQGTGLLVKLQQQQRPVPIQVFNGGHIKHQAIHLTAAYRRNGTFDALDDTPIEDLRQTHRQHPLLPPAVHDRSQRPIRFLGLARPGGIVLDLGSAIGNRPQV
jgi:hypothetical protein